MCYSMALGSEEFIGTFVPFPSIPISLTCIPEAKSALAHRRFSEVERRTKAEQIRDEHTKTVSFFTREPHCRRHRAAFRLRGSRRNNHPSDRWREHAHH